MGCFGSMEETGKKTTSTTNPAYITDASQALTKKATDFANTPVTNYSEPLTAGITDDQNSAFGLIRSIAGSNNPYLSDITSLYNQFSSTPASKISAANILGGDKTVNNTTISDYMSPYIAAALQPQLQDITRSGIQQRQGLDASATMDGAFGDARSGVALAEQLRNEQQNRTNTIGTGYNTAFDKASALRSTDITNNVNAQKSTADLLEQALNRKLTGGKALTDLDTTTTNRNLTTAKALSDAGKTQQETEQADLTAKYSEFLRQQGWTEKQISALSTALSSAKNASDTTSTATTAEPNNSGWGAVGSVASSILSAYISDRRLKHDIGVVGATLDGLPIYRFKYIGSEVWQIGLMAQDVEEVNPAAVREVDGVKMVEYGLATEAAAEIGASV